MSKNMIVENAQKIQYKYSELPPYMVEKIPWNKLCLELITS